MRRVFPVLAPVLMAGALVVAACSPKAPPQVSPKERSWPAASLREFCFRASPEAIQDAFGPPDSRPSAHEWIYERLMVAPPGGGPAAPVRVHVFFKPTQDPPHALQVSETRIGP